jgi:hypothetical protein
MRNLASTMFAIVALGICSPSISLALPLAVGIDRSIAAAPVTGQVLAIKDQARRSRADAGRRYTILPYYANHPSGSYGVYGNGYPYYYGQYGYPHYYAGQYWPHYYGRYRYPGYDYSPYAFFGYRPSDFW